MINITFTHKEKTYTRINARKARRLYDSGVDLMVCACRLDPVSPWLNGPTFNNHGLEKWELEKAFSKFVNAFTYYNCSIETGLYPAYYVSIDEA